ncbi:MAG: flavin-dependent monooxygenase [Acetobacteraceae bacterium]|nr:flavin-dependent monooxygenase [Acetobacteraceae bacterium]
MRPNLRAVLPAIAANARRAEEQRAIPAENVRLLKGIGFTRAFLRRRYGGLEMTAAEYGPCLVELAQACGATAWAVGLLAQHSHGVGLMSGRLQDEVWGGAGGGGALVCSSVAPSGACEEVEGGGVRLSGRFRFSSGCDHADWAVLGFLRRAAGEGGGTPGIHLAVLPRKDYAIVDDWHVAGMRGTGTKTIVVEDAFVPEHRIESHRAMLSGGSGGLGAADRRGIFSGAFVTYFALGFSAVSLGIATRMAQVYKESTAGRLRAYTGAKVADSAAPLARLAESAHQINAASSSLAQDWRRITERSDGDEPPSQDEVVSWRCNQAYATKMCVEATDRLFAGLGSGAWHADSEAQLLWRNAKMTGAHAFTDYDTAGRIYGRHLMGLEPDRALI